MAEAHAEQSLMKEGEVGRDTGIISIQEARDYEDALNTIVDRFKVNLREDKEDVMEEMIHE